MVKRVLKYIIVSVILSAVLLSWGVRTAYRERGYRAVGGEALLPAYVVLAAVAMYNRKDIFAPWSGQEEEDGGEISAEKS